MPKLPPVIMLMGPTASGKTALSLFLADNLPVEIVSVDSALVYRGLDIGASKPDQQILDKYPHHLIDICSPHTAYSAATFRKMLYYRALIQGLSELPGADRDVRDMLESFLLEKGLPALHARLQSVDPEAAKKIHPNDPQRIQRALEVYEISGKPITQWWLEQKKETLPYTVTKIAVNTTERSLLHRRIELRFDEMLAQGFVAEVEQLRARGDLDLNKPAMRAVGYRQVWQYLEGDYSIEEMRNKGIVATRQLAKRQLTWLRSELDLHWFYSDQNNFSRDALNLIKSPPY